MCPPPQIASLLGLLLGVLVPMFHVPVEVGNIGKGMDAGSHQIQIRSNNFHMHFLVMLCSLVSVYH